MCIYKKYTEMGYSEYWWLINTLKLGTPVKSLSLNFYMEHLPFI